MAQLLMVPTHLDALVLTSPTPVVSAMADFSKLPYAIKGVRDVNPDTAFVSESILSQPFADESLVLKPGVHLHWSLPDALTKGVQTDKGLTFPPVPDRWLVTRTMNNQSEQWLVESNYLHEPGLAEAQTAVSYPYSAEGVPQPYRRMGRIIRWQDWLIEQDEGSTGNYTEGVTAVGYGEPTFAAFYPNCHSVFGFFTPDLPNPENEVTFQIIGWYSNRTFDPMQSDWLQAANQLLHNRYQPSESETERVKWAALEAEFNWTVADSTQSYPDLLICYSQLTIPANVSREEDPSRAQAVHAVLGNSGEEALSAYLSQTIASDNTAKLEDQLEAVHLMAVDEKKIDTGPAFLMARHENEFQGIPAGVLWTIHPQDANSKQVQITLPDELGDRLNQLNQAQQQYDQAQDKISSLRSQLFSDWYKLLLSRYAPEDARQNLVDADEIQFYLHTYLLPELTQLEAETGKLNIEVAQSDVRRYRARSDDESSQTLAAKVQDFVTEIQAVLVTRPDLQLTPIAGPRYWQPNEPTILLAGDAVKSTPRHGEDGRLHPDGLLECQLLEIEDTIVGALIEIQAQIGSLQPPETEERIGFANWPHQPWHPIFLEWEVELFPLQEGSNIQAGSRHYGSDFITQNFQLAHNAVELSSPEPPPVQQNANVYFGRSLLTPHVGNVLRQNIVAFLQRRLLKAYFSYQDIPLTERRDDYFEQHLDEIVNWYRSSDDAAIKDATIDQLLLVYETVNEPSFRILAQTLTGFNQALLMQKQSLQMPIEDPLDFVDNAAFVQQIQQAIGKAGSHAPQPHVNFNPIRAGELKILRLRLVDSFGQVQDLPAQPLATTHKMAAPGSSERVSLGPRLTQPARLNFRWLSASHQAAGAAQELEMNSHPATSAVAGWLLPNFLDYSLMVYDQSGSMLGMLVPRQEEIRWLPAPGQQNYLLPMNIPNIHLRNIVQFILAQDGRFHQTLLSAITISLEMIEPPSQAHHEAKALLFGRPLAVVRASLNLEIKGNPAINQDWNVFRQDLQHGQRTTDGFTQVNFPIRLGEHSQLHDGLVGYWLEAADEQLAEGLLYMPQVHDEDMPSHPKIVTHTEERPLNLQQSIDDQPHIFTMLVDPRGVVHATSGVLPSKAIAIPPDQYMNALKNMEIAFLTAPILTTKDEIHLPLTAVPGYTWQWATKENGAWQETAEIKGINSQADFTAENHLHEGWLILKQTDAEETE